MHAKSSHKTQTALRFGKDVGHLESGNVRQFVGDGGTYTAVLRDQLLKRTAVCCSTASLTCVH